MRTAFGALVLAAAAVTSACTAASTPTTPSTGAGSTPATTAPLDARAPVRRGESYLALGDSVSFGYREPNARPTPHYADAQDFTGFPELVASRLHLRLANASCPGETSASLIDRSAPSNGCERTANGGTGYRSTYPLHVSYKSAQLAYGLRRLRTQHDTGLVTLMVGANDAFRCEATTSDRCTSEIPTVLARVTRNVRHIVRAVRGVYRGRIVLLTYYASDYTGLAATASSVLDAAVEKGVEGEDVVVADGYSAFEAGAKQHGGDSCRAGLLTRLKSGGCGVHPSATGQQLLARAVERAATRPS